RESGFTACSISIRTTPQRPVFGMKRACKKKEQSAYSKFHSGIEYKRQMSGFNFYEDGQYAEAYSKFEVSGTYYLAYRDLPQIFAKHITGWKALYFGCGAGRSTRFLQKLGFVVTGLDISEEMLKKAKQKDPAGDYRLVHGDDFGELTEASFDLILSAFPFD